MENVVYFKTDGFIDEAKLIAACDKLHIDHYLNNSFSFCPVLIGYLQKTDNKRFLYIQNVNDGFFKSLSGNNDVILKQTNSLKDFVKETYFLNHQDLNKEIETENSLF